MRETRITSNRPESSSLAGVRGVALGRAETGPEQLASQDKAGYVCTPLVESQIADRASLFVMDGGWTGA